MAKTVVMPKLGLTMTEGLISKWLKNEGDAISVGEDLFEVETDKLTNTIQANAEGILRKILIPAGEKEKCLSPVAIIAGADEDISALLPTNAATETIPAMEVVPAATQAKNEKTAVVDDDGRVLIAPAAKKLAKELGIDYTKVTGTGPKGRITLDDIKNYTPASPVEVSTEAQTVDNAPKATSLAKKMAEDKGIDLNAVPANGRISAADIMAFAAGTVAAPAEVEKPSDRRVPMSSMRKVIARRMSESKAISPTVTYDISINMTNMKAAKAQLASEGVKVSYTDILVKFVTLGLKKFPLLNCSIDGDDIIEKDYVNMGVAVALPDGLLVPVIKNAQNKSLTEISAEVKQMADDAKAGRLAPDALQGGTFTITNLGMYGIESFSPIINQPEVAILGVNTMKDTQVIDNGQPVIQPLMKLSLTADHRVVDGAVAAQFLSYVKNLMEKPALIW